MRSWRPYLFSDSDAEQRHVMSRAAFELHLDTLTNRKEETQFEHFCRRLAEKELCPNLRVQTGPTGGGDSKVDSETYPVAETIAERWWTGEPSAAGDRWAFAFSAKKAWIGKVKADVASIAATGRGYKRIYFITSQNAPDKKRAKLEDQLSSQYGIPVTILDRQWITDKVFSNDRLSLAIRTLGIEGALNDNRRRAGPRDVARLRELEELDKEVADPERYRAARYQLVEDCLRTAVLARGLERPRNEIDARFAHAARLAADRGDKRQQLRIAYTRAWTSYWWLEDFSEFCKSYDEAQSFADGSLAAGDITKIATLWQLLLPLVSGERLSATVAKIDDRRRWLEYALAPLAADTARPNNAAEARTSLMLIGVVADGQAGNELGLAARWRELSELLDSVDALGAYSVESLHQILTSLGEVADSPEFDALYEKSVAVISKRRNDGEAGKAYAERGRQKLKLGKPYEAIRWFGLAEAQLIKEEYRSELVDALLGAGMAYDDVGLLWAARNKFLAATERLLDEQRHDGEVSFITLGVLQELVNAELKLGRVPHVITAMMMAAATALRLKMADRNAELYRSIVTHQDAVLGLLLLRLTPAALGSVTKLHDTLDNLGMHAAACGLVCSLGDKDQLRALGYVPKDQSDAATDQFVAAWLDQPAAKEMPEEVLLLDQEMVTFRSVILGCEFITVVDVNKTSVAVAEAVLGSLEAFAATSTETDLAPHREQLVIRVGAVPGSAAPSLSMDQDQRGGFRIVHGTDFEMSSAAAMSAFGNWLVDAITRILIRAMMVRDTSAWLDRVAGRERGLTRAVTFSNTLILNDNVFGSNAPLKIQDHMIEGARELTATRALSLVPSKAQSTRSEPLRFGKGAPPDGMLDPERLAHTDRKVLSPIDVELWDKAQWKGTMFAIYQGDVPPVMALCFTDRDAAAAILKDWVKRWGLDGSDGALRVVVVTGLDKNNAATYAVMIGPEVNGIESDTTKLTMLVSRINRMTPTTSRNLDMFVDAYRSCGCYSLTMAGLADGDAGPPLLLNARLMRTKLEIRWAWEIGDNDPDAVVLSDDDDPIIPAGVSSPPVLDALRMMKRVRAQTQRPTTK